MEAGCVDPRKKKNPKTQPPWHLPHLPGVLTDVCAD